MRSEAAVDLDTEDVEGPKPKAPRERTVMVSARIPMGLRNRVNDILKKRGTTQTELILAAYNYVFATGELPEYADRTDRGRHGYNPATEDIEKFKEHMRSLACRMEPECEDWDYDRMKFEAMRERYPEHLGNVEYREGQ